MQPRIPHPYVDLNAADAARLNVKDGATVTLAAGGWQASATARVGERGRAPEGVILMPASLGNPVPPRATPVTVTVAASAEKEAVHVH